MKPAATVTHNPNDNQTGTPQVLEFGYDEMNRLVSAEAEGGSETYADNRAVWV